MHTGWCVVNQQGAKILDVEPWLNAPCLDLETWLRWKPVRTSSLMIRNDWLQQVGGFDIQLQQAHDLDLVLRLAHLGCPTTWLRKILVGYREHSHNTTRNAPVQAQSILAVLNKLFATNHLPPSILEIESQIRYSTLVWLAYHHYHTGYLTEMTHYLKESLNHTPYLQAETISDWVDSFTRFSTDLNRKFDLVSLQSSMAWHQLMLDMITGS